MQTLLLSQFKTAPIVRVVGKMSCHILTILWPLARYTKHASVFVFKCKIGLRIKILISGSPNVVTCFIFLLLSLFFFILFQNNGDCIFWWLFVTNLNTLVIQQSSVCSVYHPAIILSIIVVFDYNTNKCMYWCTTLSYYNRKSIIQYINTKAIKFKLNTIKTVPTFSTVGY